MTVATRVRISLLGGFRAELHPGGPLVLPTRKTQALLAYLALPLGQAHPREQLAALLWGDMQEAQARGNLRHALSRMRKALPSGAQPGLILDGPSVALAPAMVDVDVAEFERLIADGSAGALEKIAHLYRGDLLAGLSVTERPFEEWLTSERERLHEMAIQGLGRLLTHQQRAGAVEGAVQTGVRLLALDPLQEPVHRAIMRLYARLGRREAALRQYQLCVEALKRELHAEPEAETTQLYQDIRRSRSAHAGVAAEPETGPAALGRPSGPTADLLATAAAALPEAPPQTNLPAPATGLIGRADALAEVRALLAAHRCVTLIGAGGIGKTTLGLEAARQQLGTHRDGVWVAELAPLSDPDLVPVVVATALGLTLPIGADSPDRVASALGSRRVLVVMDNCEHVIEAAARMAEALVRANPHVRVMATSREPLRAPGEYVYRVLSLQVPAEGTEGRAALLETPAVKLFVTRAQAMDQRWSLDERGAAITGAICRRLDGIPLAIELAAARTVALGVERLAAHLDDRFRLLTGGYRTALPRHQTLRATLDWSYDLLPLIQRTVLNRLGVFAGGFTLEAASAVAAAGDVDAAVVVDSIANLVAKSLVAVDIAASVPRYRLLETTRAYALEKLTQAGELQHVARRHAEYFRDLFEQAAKERHTRSPIDWLAVYGWRIDNVRAALDWAFSPNGDTSVGIVLTAAAVPLWLQLSLLLECRSHAERALTSLARGPGGDPREMELYAALGISLMHTKGGAPETFAAWTKVLELADGLGDREYQLRSLWGLWHFHASRGEARRGLVLAERFREKATDTADRAVGERMVGASLHYLGDHAHARQQMATMLEHYVDSVRRSHAGRFQYDQRVAAQNILVRILWLQGFPEQAWRSTQDNIEEARALDHAVSLCNALEIPCLLGLWRGDLTATEHSVRALLDHTVRHSLVVRHQAARCFSGALLISRGQAREGLDVLRPALAELRETSFVPYYPVLLGTLARGLAGIGELDDALGTIEEALEKCERDEERWWIAELLRIKADLIMQAGGPGAAPAAEEQLQQGVEWARRQGALSMELRCATGLARRWLEQGRTEAARELLAPVYSRFTEGFDTADLQAAEALLGRFGKG